jgi:diguanylate cyclase (GGDEF)-like protein
MDGHFAVGALILLGAPVPPDGPLAEQIGRLVVELGPRVAAARAVQEAERRAVSDPLTGLKNRREFERALGAFTSAQKSSPAALIYTDLDHFKRLNDTLGHAAGDAALRHVAGILEQQIREGDVVARIGGEEFALWLPGAPLGSAMEVAERIRRAVEQTIWRWNGSPYPLTTSCGVAAYPEVVGTVQSLTTAADAALYKAKQAGRNRVEKAGSGA